MKKLISNISSIAISVFAFLGFLMPALTETLKSVLGEKSESVSGFDFISFKVLDTKVDVLANLNTLEIVFSVVAILFFVVAGLLAIVSILNFVMDSKKLNLGFIQAILAIVLSVLAIILLVMVIAYVTTYNDNIGGGNLFKSIGVGMILIPIVTLIGTALTVMFNGKKK